MLVAHRSVKVVAVVPEVGVMVGAAFKRLATKAGLPTGARLHDLRHACAVLLRLRGVPIVAVGEMLGHASASFTISNYEHVVHEMQEATADAMERRLGG